MRSRYVLPGAPYFDGVDSLSRNSVVPPYLFAASAVLPNGWNLGFRKGCSVVVRAVRVTAFSHHFDVVVRRTPPAQMIRVAARRVVAGVQRMVCGGWRLCLAVKDECDAWRVGMRSSKAQLAIAKLVSAKGPLPAALGPVAGGNSILQPPQGSPPFSALKGETTIAKLALIMLAAQAAGQGRATAILNGADGLQVVSGQSVLLTGSVRVGAVLAAPDPSIFSRGRDSFGVTA